MFPSKDGRALGAQLDQSFPFSFLWSKASSCAQMPLGESNQQVISGDNHKILLKTSLLVRIEILI